jgi:hypothetical protein
VEKNWSIVRIFLVKKLFTVDQVCNWRNDLSLGSSIDPVQGTFRTKLLAQVMVLGMLMSDRKTMQPYFFKAGEKVDADMYVKVLRHTLLPWLNNTT